MATAQSTQKNACNHAFLPPLTITCCPLHTGNICHMDLQDIIYLFFQTVYTVTSAEQIANNGHIQY